MPMRDRTQAASRARRGVDHEPARRARRRCAEDVRAVPELVSRVAPGAAGDHALRARAGRASRNGADQARKAVPDDALRDRRRSTSIGRFQTREQRLGVYAKSYPVGAGVSSLNVNALWHAADGSGAPLYIRGVPTGPASPIVVRGHDVGRTRFAPACHIERRRSDRDEIAQHPGGHPTPHPGAPMNPLPTRSSPHRSPRSRLRSRAARRSRSMTAAASRTVRGAAECARSVARRAGRYAPDPALQERLLALDPEHISDRDVRETLAQGPTPRIMLLHGGIYPVHLADGVVRPIPDAAWAIPEAQHSRSRRRRLVVQPVRGHRAARGIVAWQYEHDGLRPMLIGHSQGGMQAVKILQELDGRMRRRPARVEPARPLRSRSARRIVDPLTGTRAARRRRVGRVCLGGRRGRLRRSCCRTNGGSLDKLRKIPDTVDEFTGYFIERRLDRAGASPATRWTGATNNSGKAHVRNVDAAGDVQPRRRAARGRSLADEPAVRDWINAYVPGDARDTSSLPGDAAGHVLWAADVWYSIKKHWCLEAQHWVRAQSRERAGGTVAQ